MHLNHLTFLSDIIMHHDSIANFNFIQLLWGRYGKTHLKKCLFYFIFLPGGRKCMFVVFPSMAPENWGRTSQLQFLLITMGRLRISLICSFCQLQHCHLFPRFLFPGTSWHTLGWSPTAWGYCQGHAISQLWKHLWTSILQNIPEALLSLHFRAPCLHRHCLLFLAESFIGLLQ